MTLLTTKSIYPDLFEEHFHYYIITFSETLYPLEKNRALWLVNGECNENNIAKTKRSWLIVPSKTFSIVQSQSRFFQRDVRFLAR